MTSKEEAGSGEHRRREDVCKEGGRGATFFLGGGGRNSHKAEVVMDVHLVNLEMLSFRFGDAENWRHCDPYHRGMKISPPKSKNQAFKNTVRPSVS